jgi:flagellar hook-length control protein FliK
VPTSSLTASADGDAAQQVIRSMRLQWSGTSGEAQLRLQPEHLGQVLVSVRVDQGNVSATLHADSATAQQWIESHQQELRQALQDQGLKVTQFNVTVNPDDRGRRDASSQQQQSRDQQDQAQSGRSRTLRDTSNGRTFEVRV